MDLISQDSKKVTEKIITFRANEGTVEEITEVKMIK